MRKAWWVLLRRWLFTTGNGEEFASKLRGLHCFFSISEIGFKDFLFYPYLGKTWLVFFKWDKATNWKMIFQQTFLPVLNVFVCHLCIAWLCVVRLSGEYAHIYVLGFSDSKLHRSPFWMSSLPTDPSVFCQLLGAFCITWAFKVPTKRLTLMHPTRPVHHGAPRPILESGFRRL